MTEPASLHERITAKLDELEKLNAAEHHAHVIRFAVLGLLSRLRPDLSVEDLDRECGLVAQAVLENPAMRRVLYDGQRIAEDRDMLDLADRLTGDANEAFSEGSTEGLTLLATARHLERSLARRHGIEEAS